MSDNANNVNTQSIDLATAMSSNNPVASEKDYGAYVDVLESKIEDQSVRNIGVIAPYGAGKSSLLATYAERVKKSKKILTVSLANFNSRAVESDLPDHDNSNESKDSPKNTPARYRSCVNDLNCALEKSILQQILYSVGRKDLPSSRIKRVDDRHWGITALIAALAIFFLSAITATVLEFKNILPFSNGKLFYWLAVVSVVFGFFFLWFAICSGWLKRVNIKDIEVALDDCNDKRILNHFIDEILYFFKKRKIDVVVIEDLDRFDNTDIFSTLRELNALINGSTMVKQKVTFVYAVKDDLFNSETERAKFFDYILSLIPIMSPSNAKDLLSRSLREKCPSEMQLPAPYIQDVSYFVTEVRVLKNIINDYIAYYHLLKLQGANENSKIKLFSLMIYKNVRPQDFAQLQFGNGTMADIFKKTAQYTQKRVVSVDRQIQQLETELTESAKEQLKSFEQLKLIVMGAMLRAGGHDYYTRVRGQDINILSTFEGIEDGLKYRDNENNSYYYHISIAQLESTLGEPVVDIEKRIIRKSQEKRNEISRELMALRKLKREIANYTVKELLTDQDGESLLHEELRKDRFVLMLLKNGYIAEDYKDYVCHNDQDIISNNDQEFIRSVIAKTSGDLTAVIGNPECVIKLLPEVRFQDKYILNFTLVQWLLMHQTGSTEYHSKRDRIIRYLASGDEISDQFIVAYIANEYDLDALIDTVAPHYSSFAGLVLNAGTLSDTVKIQILKALLKEPDRMMLSEQNQNNVIADFLRSRESLVNDFGDMDGQALVAAIEVLKMTVLHLKCDSKYYNIVQKIANMNLYDINLGNLDFILFELKSLERECYQRAVFTAALECGDTTIIDYVREQIAKVVDVITSQEHCSEHQEAIEIILKSENVTLEQKQRLIEKLDVRFNYFEGLSKELLLYAYEKNVMLPAWENIIVSLRQTGGLPSQIRVFLEQNADELATMQLDDASFADQLAQVQYTDIRSFEKIVKAFAVDLQAIEKYNDCNTAVLVQADRIECNDQNFQKMSKKPQALGWFLYKHSEYLDKLTLLTYDQACCAGIMTHPVLNKTQRATLLVHWQNQYKPETLKEVAACYEILQNYSYPTKVSVEFVKHLIASPHLDISPKCQLLIHYQRIMDTQQFVSVMEEISPDYAGIKTKALQKIRVTSDNSAILGVLNRKGYLKTRQMKGAIYIYYN